MNLKKVILTVSTKNSYFSIGTIPVIKQTESSFIIKGNHKNTSRRILKDKLNKIESITIDKTDQLCYYVFVNDNNADIETAKDNLLQKINNIILKFENNIIEMKKQCNKIEQIEYFEPE